MGNDVPGPAQTGAEIIRLVGQLVAAALATECPGTRLPAPPADPNAAAPGARRLARQARIDRARRAAGLVRDLPAAG